MQYSLENSKIFACEWCLVRNFVTSPREPPGKASRSELAASEVANPVIPTKPNEARRCRKTSSCFICLGARPLASQWHRKQNKGCEATFLRNEVLSAPAASRIGKASRSEPAASEVANSVIPAPSSQSPPLQSSRHFNQSYPQHTKRHHNSSVATPSFIICGPRSSICLFVQINHTLPFNSLGRSVSQKKRYFSSSAFT